MGIAVLGTRNVPSQLTEKLIYRPPPRLVCAAGAREPPAPRRLRAPKPHSERVLEHPSMHSCVLSIAGQLGARLESARRKPARACQRTMHGGTTLREAMPSNPAPSAANCGA
uniref:Uncharacterized protein n=1 Tax=Chlamydomonas euryale TaxID=1486919 RepID=A0A7R9V6C1_9CHLO